jgi:hypothetical protein
MGKRRAAWDRFVDLAGLHIDRIGIPYEGTTLPGYFFRSGPAGEPRRTLIFNNGSDGPATAAWVQGVADALRRGWNAMTFDGPGQNAALVRQQLTFRPPHRSRRPRPAAPAPRSRPRPAWRSRGGRPAPPRPAGSPHNGGDPATRPRRS